MSRSPRDGHVGRVSCCSGAASWSLPFDSNNPNWAARLHVFMYVRMPYHHVATCEICFTKLNKRWISSEIQNVPQCAWTKFWIRLCGSRVSLSYSWFTCKRMYLPSLVMDVLPWLVFEHASTYTDMMWSMRTAFVLDITSEDVTCCAWCMLWWRTWKPEQLHIRKSNDRLHSSYCLQQHGA